ncbi:alpha/beta hydrolase [Prosthecobacter sp.]|uniref:alpha/beta hydrolase n=1 Tax=Prosthecobacter sp. TaxID=1965333 RepID=UPI0037843F09
MTSEHQISSALLDAPRQVRIHHAERADSCLLFLDGELYADRVKSPDVITQAQAAGMLPPLTCVYLPNLGAADRHEVYTCNDRFASFVALEMPRWIEREVGGFGRLFLCGLSLSALQSIFTALKHPDIFAGVLAQSPSAWWQNERLASSLDQHPSSRGRFWLSVGTREVAESASHPPTPLIQSVSQLASVRRLHKRMTEAGHDMHLNEYDGGHDPACWGVELPRALQWLLKL